MTDEAQTQDEKKTFKRVMTIAPFSQEAGIEGSVMLNFDMTEAQEAKNMGRMLMVKGEGDDAVKSFGTFNLQKTKEGNDPVIFAEFNEDNKDFKSLVLFKSTGDDTHNYFSGTITTADGKENRLTGNLVSVKGTAEAWLDGYVFKKGLATEVDEESTASPR